MITKEQNTDHLNAAFWNSPRSVLIIPTNSSVEATNGLKKCTGWPNTEALAISNGSTP